MSWMGTQQDQQEDRVDWRDENDDAGESSKRSQGTTAAAAAAVKSFGIQPTQFYKEKKKRDRFVVVHKLLQDASKTVLRQERQQFTDSQKLRRAAFRDVTSLQLWPLQEWAVDDFKHLLAIHLHHATPTPATVAITTTPLITTPNKASPPLASTATLDCEFESDSTGISSLDEPKRRKEDGRLKKHMGKAFAPASPPLALTTSPGKSSLRAKYRDEFLQERSIVPIFPPVTDRNIEIDTREDEGVQTEPQESDFLPPIWSMEPRIFAVEKSAAGKRKYIVGHMGRFMDQYWRKSDPNHRHYYELIPEGTPCRLYFDLEFNKMANPEITNDICEVLMTEFMAELSNQFMDLYSIQMDQSNVVDLESSTAHKFSRHWLIHLPGGHLFADAVAAGTFVKLFVGRLAEEVATGQLAPRRPILAKYLFVNAQASKKKPLLQTEHVSNENSGTQTTHTQSLTTGLHSDTHDELDIITPAKESSSQQEIVPINDPKTCFVDLGVYTRNRLFRLMGSSKFGKPASAALRIATVNAFSFPEGFENSKFYVPDIVVETTQTDHSSDCENDALEEPSSQDLSQDDNMKKFKSSMDWNAHAEALADTLVVPLNGTKLNFPVLPDPESVCNSSALDAASGLKQARPMVSSAQINAMPRLSTSNPLSMGESPFPMLDGYVTSVLGSRGGITGAIRAWSISCVFPTESSGTEETVPNVPRSITYQMVRNRYCERINRSHKSNNIMWTIDLISFEAAQSCHDPECRALAFRGTPISLPHDVTVSVRDVLFEQELSRIDPNILKHDKIPRDASSPKDPVLNDSSDDLFEKALMALEISGHESPDTTQKTTTSNTENVFPIPRIDRNPNGSSDDFDTVLSDALLSNPELFP